MDISTGFDSHDSVGGPPISPAVLSKSKKRQAEPTEPDNLKPDACDADPCYPSKRYKENSTEAQMFPPLHVQASGAYNDRNFLLAAHRFGLLLCLHREQKSKSIPGYPDTNMVQVCLNLTQCYLNLKKAETAHEVLEDVWRPNRLLTIEVHIHFSRIYRDCILRRKIGASCKQTIKENLWNL
ncbi:uncharacterized protein MELLADRAFT_91248 [Melampsora larici-populina 98AG31]|uniref:Uncharacterized protein n=1 Tax=Melampsora larici-populina (strain 98AG31 / pathotype 3-4-7) TaxID=747676 RepID=F4SEH2_MELLP|nr:uncharacterized protein MELLADRAFT_91248 [Melampsora larici-populina 98AG31]EGF96954.1 hypothetical protein MELLADRAFT_91248 [Melampsora larici-populina 98AG31]